MRIVFGTGLCLLVVLNYKFFALFFEAYLLRSQGYTIQILVV